MFSWRTRLGLCALLAIQFVVLGSLAWARYTNVHQETFDLALYARVAFGLAHGDGWSPVLNTPVLGAHVSPVLLVLGLAGRVFGVVPVLLWVQAACVALAGYPLARIAARRLGMRGVWLAVAAWLLYPNLGHVATYEFHPGTLAVLPMAWAYDALDRSNLRGLAWSCFFVLMCREDLGAFCVIIALLAYKLRGDRACLQLAAACFSYSLVGTLLVVFYAPEDSSLSAHFGIWGGSPFGVIKTLFTDPARVWEHYTARPRLTYLLRVLAPLSLFSLRAPLLLLPAVPYLLLNLTSEFPTAQQQFSHYLTPSVPAIVASGLVGVVQAQSRRFVRGMWFLTLGIGFFALGGLPLSYDFKREPFVADAQTLAAREVLAQIPDAAHVSVQAPDALLPHLAERYRVHRAPPPDFGTDYVVLDVSHRARYAKKDDLLRTQEEPVVRSFLARDNYALVLYAEPYALFKRGESARDAAPVQRFFAPADRAADAEGAALQKLTACLSSAGAELATNVLELHFIAHGPCPQDLALYLGTTQTPERTDLLFEGKLSPAQLRAGDRLVSPHVLSERELKAYRESLFIGLLRESGARPEPEDPAMVHVKPALRP